MTRWLIGSSSSSSAGGGGGGAPTNASYLVLGIDGGLTDERVFTPGASLAATDGGAGGAYALDLAAVPGVVGSYTYASLTLDGYGRVTAASDGVAPVVSVAVDAGELTNTGTATAPVLGLAPTAVGVGSYTYASLTVDAFGRLTAVSNGVAPPAASTVTVDVGELTNTGTATAAVLGLANAGTPNTYAYPASVTTDAFGRVTAVTPGAAPAVVRAAVTVGFGAQSSNLAQATVIGQPWVTADSVIYVTPLVPVGKEVEIATLSFSAVVHDLVIGTGFSLTVFAPYGARGSYTFSCLGV